MDESERLADDATSDSRQLTEAELRAVTVGEPIRLDGPIRLSPYDPVWPERFAAEAVRIRAALGRRALAVEHVGSTAVPGLAAKPWIDVLLVVADSADEAAYASDLIAAGYVVRNREPAWHEHRLCTRPDVDLQIHVFSAGCPEIERMTRFRDWLRRDEGDRQRYEQTKRRLARRTWTYLQHYAAAKSAIIEAILARATRDDATDRGADGEADSAPA